MMDSDENIENGNIKNNDIDKLSLIMITIMMMISVNTRISRKNTRTLEH